MRTALITAAIAVALAAGCGGEKVEYRATGASVGQQLNDLQKAYEAGAITKEEYERERKKVLNR